MSDTRSYRKESRADWGTSSLTLTLEQLQTGAILRIADATEAMAKNHVQLQAEVDRLNRWYDHSRKRSAKLERSNVALRGHITRLKKKLNRPNNE